MCCWACKQPYLWKDTATETVSVCYAYIQYIILNSRTLFAIWWRSKYIWGQNLSMCQGMKVGHLPWLVYMLPCCILVHYYSINYETGRCPYIICSSMDKQMFVCFLIVSSHLSFICSLWISYYHQWTIVKTFCQHQLKKLLLRNLKKLDFFLFPRSKQYL